MIEKVANVILKSKHLIALTGAGISAESGIPTFRGPNGLSLVTSKTVTR